MNKHEVRDETTGRYAVGYDAPCKCGHSKGMHTAGPRGNSAGDCIMCDYGSNCDCEKFRHDKKAEACCPNPY